MLGRGGPVGVDRLDVLGVGLALPADQELLGQRGALVDLALRDDRRAEAAGRLGGVRQHHHRDPGEVEAGLLVADVVGLAACRASARASRPAAWTSARTSPVWIGDVVGLGRRQARAVGAVDEQAPDVLERHPADDVLDVDAAVAERGPLLVGLGDLGPERDDALETLVYLYASTVICHVAHCAVRSPTSARSARYVERPWTPTR